MNDRRLICDSFWLTSSHLKTIFTFFGFQCSSNDKMSSIRQRRSYVPLNRVLLTYLGRYLIIYLQILSVHLKSSIYSEKRTAGRQCKNPQFNNLYGECIAIVQCFKYLRVLTPKIWKLCEVLNTEHELSLHLTLTNRTVLFKGNQYFFQN